MEMHEIDEVVSRFLPDHEQRIVALQQLLLSSDYANLVAPQGWGVTLYANLFRLNVGVVEVLVASSDHILLNCIGDVASPPFDGDLFRETNYRSIPAPQCAYAGPIDEFAALQDSLQPFHRKFIDIAGRTKSGAPVKGSVQKRSHSPELIAYARQYVDAADSANEPWLQAGETLDDRRYIEGKYVRVLVDRFERDRRAREKCLAHYSAMCVVCGFRSVNAYGDQCDGIIHVHHLVQLSEIRGAHVVDPVRDLRPVCPNCHAVIHSRQPPFSIEEVRQMIVVATDVSCSTM